MTVQTGSPTLQRGAAMASCVPPTPSARPRAHLGQFGLGEAWLAHLGGLAHGHVALREGPLREGL